MAATANTVEVVLRANVGDFQRAIQQGVGTLRGEFSRASSDVRGETNRIREATRQLGIRPFGEIQREIRELERSYRTLSRSGQLSSRELRQAHLRMREGIRQLRREQSGWVESLNRARTQMLATAAATYGLVRALSAANREYRTFEEAVASVNSLLDVSPARIQELSGEVRALAQEMGVEATNAAQALYDIISAGVPQENAIDVLRTSTRGAIAGLTDTQTAARVGLAVINAYGKEIEELGNVYDTLFATVRGGVTTLPELASALGQVLPVASGTGIAFETVAAAIQQLTQAGLGTPEAITALRGAIVNLTSPAPEAAKALEELNVQTGDFVATLRQIGQLNLGPEALRSVVPDVEARNAVLALTRDLDGLSTAIEDVSDSAGAADEAYQKLANSSAQEAREYRAALNELQLQIGELVAAGTPLLEVFTGLIRGFNELPGPIKQTTAAVVGLAGAATVLRLALAPVLTTFSLLIPRSDRLRRTLGALIPNVRTLGGLLRGLGWGAVAFEVGRAISIFVDGQRELAALTEQQEAYAESQRRIQAETERFAETQRLTRAELGALSQDEIESYRERAREAQRYYESVRDLRSREYARENGIEGISPAALAAAREAREYRESLEDVEDILEERQAAEQRHGQRLAQVRSDITATIRRRLAEEIDAYDEANEAIEKARKRREEVAERWRELEAELRRPPQTADEDLTAADLARQGDLIQGSLSNENPEEALRRAERAREIIRALAEQGNVTQQYLVSQTQRFAELADRAAAAQEAQAEQEAAEIRRTIEDLVGRAEFLRRIQVGFDYQAAEQSAEELRRRLEEQLKRNPVVIPVQLQSTSGPSDSSQQAADDLLEGLPGRAGGGPIAGPGTPTSDSILIRASNGEYMLRAAAVRYYGRSFLDALNNMRLPKFAQGGLVSRLQIPSMPSAPAGPSGSGGRPLTLVLPGGERVSATVSQQGGDVVERGLSRAALKGGR